MTATSRRSRPRSPPARPACNRFACGSGERTPCSSPTDSASGSCTASCGGSTSSARRRSLHGRRRHSGRRRWSSVRSRALRPNSARRAFVLALRFRKLTPCLNSIICTRMVSRFYFRTRQEKEGAPPFPHRRSQGTPADTNTHRRGSAEATLKHLVKQKQDKVEEIKKKTGYYSTRDLLEKYDEALRKGVRELQARSHDCPTHRTFSSARRLCAVDAGQVAGWKNPRPGRCYARNTCSTGSSDCAFDTAKPASRGAGLRRRNARGPGRARRARRASRTGRDDPVPANGTAPDAAHALDHGQGRRCAVGRLAGRVEPVQQIRADLRQVLLAQWPVSERRVRLCSCVPASPL